MFALLLRCCHKSAGFTQNCELGNGAPFTKSRILHFFWFLFGHVHLNTSCSWLDISVANLIKRTCFSENTCNLRAAMGPNVIPLQVCELTQSRPKIQLLLQFSLAGQSKFIQRLTDPLSDFADAPVPIPGVLTAMTFLGKIASYCGPPCFRIHRKRACQDGVDILPRVKVFHNGQKCCFSD